MFCKHVQDTKAHALLLDIDERVGMVVLTSTYFALYQIMNWCVREVDHCEKQWECSPSDLLCQILFFLVYSPERKVVPRESK